MVLPSKVWEDFFQKKVSHYGEVVLNRRTNDQIMAMLGRSLIGDKYIFHYIGLI